MGLYVRLESIKGAGTSRGHEGWVDASSVSWSLASSTTTMPTPGGGAGKVTAQAVQLSAPVGPHSPLVLLACVRGTHLKSVTIEHTVASPREEHVDQRWELSAVTVVDYATGATPESIGQDSFGLLFGKLVYTTIAQKRDGSAAAPISVTWEPTSGRTA
ncbi:type VI secretion system tube protein Hcp [Cellulomonas composti]|uniref:Type VI secretion system tube protein Hcp n=1 Tax=Cellulomonas composti TaxID=266130 RepID=A0A511J9W6_9CELL|nr:type VI secretion system tube protein Hcp [Cellulomonas composti]GEL94787.1 hypothetical protein CCO02nite_14450 [Cellulomonas composti]